MRLSIVEIRNVAAVVLVLLSFVLAVEARASSFAAYGLLPILPRHLKAIACFLGEA